jgi:hypothetical protein
VLVLRGVPKEAIRKLRAGYFFMGEEIVSTQRKLNYISIVTKNGSVFNAHEKPKVFNVFKKPKRPGEVASSRPTVDTKSRRKLLQ